MKRYFACIGFTVAVTLIVLNMTEVFYSFVIGAGAAVMLAATLILPKYRQERAFPVCFSAVLFACLLYCAVYYAEVVPAQLLAGQEAQAKLYLTSLPTENNGQYIYTAKTQSIIFDGAPQSITLRIKSSEPIYADSYTLINANLKFYKVGTNAFNSFGYWGKRIYLSAHIKSYEITGVCQNSLMRNILHLRQDIITTLFESVRGDEGALAAALVTGEKSLLTDEAYYSFRAAGVSHLMAVSGLHLSVITGAFSLVLKALRVNKRASSAFLIVVVVLYCALAGFSSSVVRAGIMLIVLLFGDVIKMRGDTLNSLGVAVFIICLNPFAVSDVGSVLSVLAVLALITASKGFALVEQKINKIKRLRKFNGGIIVPVIKYILNSLVLSLCVLFFTLPAMYLFFGYFSVICVFINVFIVPLGSASTVLSLITYISDKAGVLSGAANFVDSGLNSFILYLVKTASRFEFTIIRTEYLFGFVTAGILFMFGLCFLIGRKGLFKAVAVISIVSLAATSAVTLYYDKRSAQLFVGEGSAVALVEGKEAVVLGVSTKTDYYAVSSFLSVRDAEIELIAVKSDPRYSLMLAEEFGCKTIVCEDFSYDILNSDISEYITGKSYSKSSGGIACSVSYSDGFSYELSVNAININNKSVNKNSIFVARNAIYDYNGIINLENGEVLYSIYSDGTFRARRLNVWQS